MIWSGDYGIIVDTQEIKNIISLLKKKKKNSFPFLVFISFSSRMNDKEHEAEQIIKVYTLSFLIR